ncbi:hypothetical protein XH80_35485 [Bradyrhizobium sp. CCBAU 45384]|nr:hypothetical protein [Bradyrhizobium sp. CCBAU 45384]
MILTREPFGKLPHIAKNGLVGLTRWYYRILGLVRRNRGWRPQQALWRQRLRLILLVLHRRSQATAAGGCTSGLW